MQINKIKIDNSTKWDVAEYDEYVAKNGRDYYRDNKNNNRKFASFIKRKSNSTLGRESNNKSIREKRSMQIKANNRIQEQIINEEVRISDFAFSKFKELREMDGIDDRQIQGSLATHLNN